MRRGNHRGRACARYRFRPSGFHEFPVPWCCGFAFNYERDSSQPEKCQFRFQNENIQKLSPPPPPLLRVAETRVDSIGILDDLPSIRTFEPSVFSATRKKNQINLNSSNYKSYVHSLLSFFFLIQINIQRAYNQHETIKM